MAAKSATLRELERRANDLIRVFNPTNKDHVVEWDRRGGTKVFRIISQQEEVLPRYIAEKYVREMFDKIINSKAKSSIKKQNQERIGKGMSEMTPWKEQFQFESKFYSPGSDEAKKIVSLLYVGIEREYGVDSKATKEEKEPDDRPTLEKAMDEVQKEKDMSDSTADVEIDDIEVKTDEEEELTIVQSTTDTTNGEKTAKDSSDEASGTEKEVFACDYPGCDFETETKIALVGHKRSHESKKQEATQNISK